VARSPDAARRYWDRQAPTYDDRTAGMERRVLHESRRWVGERARGETLEIGIGTGANLPHYTPDVTVTGVDHSEEMLAVARRRAEALPRSVSLHRADAARLPFDDGAFETVVSTFSLCCVTDVRQAVVEALRVLRPGGRLLLADHVASSVWPLRALQHLVDLVSVPLQGEHYTRRPSLLLADLDVTVVETDRRTAGMIERVHAVKR
jgi:ubiquinone/menaquinone biosynthesis C-methylase UbiE